ncbi:hypothetical protein [Arenibacter sp. H213]|uniref:hypothetical protein n=1 Tax=Arenibacter TaxID=178469 RepID=UPI002042CC1A|nr:hypothetical protein [Arenibacter sp. H213]
MDTLYKAWLLLPKSKELMRPVPSNINFRRILDLMNSPGTAFFIYFDEQIKQMTE